MKGYVLTYAVFQMIANILALERQLTVNVQPRQQDCLFETIKENQSVEVDFQVVYGMNLDITFQAHDPSGRVIVADIKKAGNSHIFTTTMAGDYKFCFDNTFSTISDKTIFFEMTIDEDDDSLENMENLNPEEEYEVKVEDILEIIGRVKSDIMKISHLQDIIRAIEAGDRNTAEDTNSLVLISSCLQVLIMLCVCVLHNTAVKSLFEPNTMANAISWFKLRW